MVTFRAKEVQERLLDRLWMAPARGTGEAWSRDAALRFAANRALNQCRDGVLCVAGERLEVSS